MRMRPFLLMAALAFQAIAFTQEVCTNGVDDDADGLIDLNDTLDCACVSGLQPLQSLVPDPFLEDTLCCPSTVSQMACSNAWVQPTNGTCDYFNLCGFFPSWIPIPLPDGGAGCMGGFMAQGYAEYMSTCLAQPLEPDSTYALSFHMAAFQADKNELYYTVPIEFGPVEITLFGKATCIDDVLNTVECPEAYGWTALGSVLYEPSESWQPLTLAFTPAQAVQGLMLGAPCELPDSYPDVDVVWQAPYFLYDAFAELIPVAGASLVTTTGTLCQQDMVLACSVEGALSQQWYLDGVALVGQVADTLPLCQLGLGPGNYQFSAVLDTGCVTQTTVVQPPVYPDVSLGYVPGPNYHLVTAPLGAIQWYVDGVPIPGEVNDVCYPEVSGDYTVSITTNSGCTAFSEPHTVIVMGQHANADPGFTLVHAPGAEELVVRGKATSFPFLLFDANGRCLLKTLGSGTEWHLPLGDLPAGLYVALCDGQSARFIH